jgi:hypothetical protein
MRKSFLALAAAGATIFTGCVESALNPNDKVVVTGSAVNEDKSPLASVDVKLKRSGSSACLIMADYDTLKTDATGAFTKQLIGSDTQVDKNARCFSLTLPNGEKGAQVSTDFLMQVTEVKIPALQRWSGKAAVTGSDFSFEPLTTTQTTFSEASHVVEVSSGGAVIWRKDSAASPVSFSDYVLEDFQAPTASAVAGAELKGSGTTFHFRFQSDSAALPQKQLVPASRGATCAYNKAPTACPLTDGKAVSNLFENVTDITISTQGAKTIKKVVLRGFHPTLPSNVVLEGSMDGTTFTKLVDLGTGDYQEVDVPAGAASAKFFRIKGSRTDNGTFNVVSLDEISLFQ